MTKRRSKVVEHSAIFLTCTYLPLVFKTFVLSTFEWLLKTRFNVLGECLLISSLPGKALRMLNESTAYTTDQ